MVTTETIREMHLLQLRWFAEHNDIKGIEEMLEQGIPINGIAQDGFTCLDVTEEDSETFRYLVARGAFSVHLSIEIITAVQAGKIDKVKTLLDSNKNLLLGRDEYGNNLLHIAAKEIAAKEKNAPMIAMLKTHGVKADGKNQYGETYLEVAKSNQETSNPQSTAPAAVPRR